MAYFSFKLDSGNGPFTIKVRESNDPMDYNRYISGTIPNPIEYEDIPDGLPHNYIVSITSPSCSAFEASFTTTSSCKAKPSLELQQNCDSFTATGKAFVKIKAALEGYSRVLLQVYDGAKTLISEEIDTGVFISREIPNRKNLKFKASNTRYGTCFTEVNFSTLCTAEVVCDIDIEIGNVSPDQVRSVTPIPAITSAKIENGVTTIVGTASCNGTVKLYKRNTTTNGWTSITERTIQVTNGAWSHIVNTDDIDTYAVDGYCSQYTDPSNISAGFTSVEVPVDPPEETVVIQRIGFSFSPGNNSFIGVQVNGNVEAKLVSTNNSTDWKTLDEYGFFIGGTLYNKRLVIPNLPSGNYTIFTRPLGQTQEVSSSVSVGNQGFETLIYDKDAVPPEDNNSGVFRAVAYITTN